jgi:uncharacterized protein (DUF433 family)
MTYERNKRGVSRAAVIKGVELGMTVKEIIQAFNLTDHTVRGTAIKLGLKIKGIRPYPAYGSLKDIINQAHAEGLTYAEAALKYDVSRVQLRNAAKSYKCYLKTSKHRT